MISRPLQPTVLAAILFLLTANLLLAAWSHRFPYYRKLEEIRKAQDPNLLFLGNSLLDGNVDAPAIEAAAAQHGVRVAPLDAALGATQPPEHLLLFDYTTRCHPGMRVLVLGIYDFQLSESDAARPADLIGNRVLAVDPRFTFSEIASVYRFGPLQDAEFESLRILPLLAYRTNAWKYTELLRRKMESMGMPGEASNRMGRVSDFDLLEAASVQSFDAQARAFLAHPAFNASYETLFSEARHADMKPVILVMPMSPSHRQQFYARPAWTQYLRTVETLARGQGIHLLDASDWMPSESDFVDHLHMSKEAASRFSTRLSGELAQDRSSFAPMGAAGDQ